jgi:hypothetical protein
MKKGKMAHCFSTHSIIHSIIGLGVGIFLVGLLPTLGSNAVITGLVILVVGIVLDMVMVK